MNLNDVWKNKMLIAVALIIVLAIVFSPWGIEIRAGLLGNPCPGGQVFNPQLKTCMPAATPVVCGGGTYLDFSPITGYSCKLSNLTILLIVGVAALLIYFVFFAKKAQQWIAAKEAVRCSFENGHLQTEDGRNDFVSVWSHVKEPHQIKPHDAWLVIGDFVQPGKEYSALIAGTDKSGWVLRLWRYPLGDRQIQILMKKGMELEKALSEVAAYHAKTKTMIETLKTEEGEGE